MVDRSDTDTLREVATLESRRSYWCINHLDNQALVRYYETAV
jgi:hypothetical protein